MTSPPPAAELLSRRGTPASNTIYLAGEYGVDPFIEAAAHPAENPSSGRVSSSLSLLPLARCCRARARRRLRPFTQRRPRSRLRTDPAYAELRWGTPRRDRARPRGRHRRFSERAPKSRPRQSCVASQPRKTPRAAAPRPGRAAPLISLYSQETEAQKPGAPGRAESPSDAASSSSDTPLVCPRFRS